MHSGALNSRFHRRPPLSLLSIGCVYLSLLSQLLLPLVHAQETRPSNSSADLPGHGSAQYILRTQQLKLQPLELLPLTRELSSPDQDRFETFNVTGRLVNASPNNADGLDTADIAYICCDASAYAGNIDGDGILRTVINKAPTASAVIFYSTELEHCNYSSPTNAAYYTNIFTVVSDVYARAIRDGLAEDNPGSSSILPDMRMVSDGHTGTDDGGGGTGGSGSSSSGPGHRSQEPSPTTSVAMIILYSVTGIITALFLGVILTGAIRAHRHPERYGPRNVIGRPRQSRAKGIARAMLDTLPIVKFGEKDENGSDAMAGKPADVEMASNDGENEAVERHANETATNDPDKGATSTAAGADGERSASPEAGVESSPPRTDGAAQHQQSGGIDTQGSVVTGDNEDGPIGPATSTPERKTPVPEGDGNGILGCPICTEDFVKGQDVRLLPCDHKFHPDCIDPWLVNVSGTCPLCRVDLHPHEEEEAEDSPPADGSGSTNPSATHADGAAPATATEEPSTIRRQRHRLSAILHPSHSPSSNTTTIATTVEERLNAVRRHRAAHQQGTGNNNNPTTATGALDETMTRSGHNRLSARFRDRLRIRSSQPPPPPSTPPASGS